jgi:vanillate O-demethylase monooxygenase subunit
VVRLADGVTVLPDACPHRFAPLSAGSVVDGELQCPYHGWRFGADGGCRFIPALGPGAALPPKADIAVPATLVAYDLVFVCLEPGADDAAMLEVPEWAAPGIVAAWLPVVTARIGSAQLLDNFLDFSHFPFVHAGTFGSGEDAVIGDYDVERGPTALRVRYDHVIENAEDPGVAAGERPLVQPRTMEYTFRVPFAGRLRLELPLTGVENTIALWASPVDADHTRIFTVLLRNDLPAADSPEAQAAVAFELKVLEEDLSMLERLPSTVMPLELPAQAHTRADRITVEMRRLLSAAVT